jgi:5-methylcytosine-specific restriction protein A
LPKDEILIPTKVDFLIELQKQIDRAIRQGRLHIEINAGELHRVIGGYPSRSARMPVCCTALREELQRRKGSIIFEPPSGQGAALTIRYDLR